MTTEGGRDVQTRPAVWRVGFYEWDASPLPLLRRLHLANRRRSKGVHRSSKTRSVQLVYPPFSRTPHGKGDPCEAEEGVSLLRCCHSSKLLR